MLNDYLAHVKPVELNANSYMKAFGNASVNIGDSSYNKSFDNS